MSNVGVIWAEKETDRRCNHLIDEGNTISFSLHDIERSNREMSDEVKLRDFYDRLKYLEILWKMKRTS